MIARPKMSQVIIRVLPFLGKESEWRMCSRKFIATSVARGYKDVLEPADPAKDADPEQNSKSYNDPMLSINNETTFGIVDEARTEAFPEG